MAELFDRLEKAGALLSSAIDQYLDACVAIGSFPRLSFGGVSRAFFDRVSSELLLVTSYETKIKQAKATISYTANSSWPTSHINSLPSEILTRIFFMVTDACYLTHDAGNSIPLPRYPDFLSHVCTRWRRIALDSPHLWTHIDLVRLSAPNHGFKPRAETFISRAGSCLLHLHVYEQAECYKYDHQSMMNVITITAPQTRSLELVAYHIPGYGQAPRPIDHCFDKCIPGVLTKLNLTKVYNPRARFISGTHFIDSSDRPNDSHTSTPLSFTAERLDALLLPITHLQLDSIYFPWTHRAYHGLVELRLLANDECVPPITELELVGILVSSPALKLLHFEIDITAEQTVGTAIAPVRLDSLEVLTVHSSSDENLNPHHILSLLAPGPKPLRASLILREYIDVDSSRHEWVTQIKDFFKCSNITQLHLQCIIWLSQVGPEDLLEPLSNLRALALERCHDRRHCDSSPPPPFGSVLPRLDIMYMVECTLIPDRFARTLKHFQVEQVVFWRCGFLKDGSLFELHGNHEAIKTEFGTICQSILWIDRNEPSPIKHWD